MPRSRRFENAVSIAKLLFLLLPWSQALKIRFVIIVFQHFLKFESNVKSVSLTSYNRDFNGGNRNKLSLNTVQNVHAINFASALGNNISRLTCNNARVFESMR